MDTKEEFPSISEHVLLDNIMYMYNVQAYTTAVPLNVN